MAALDAAELVRRLRGAELSVSSIEATSKWIAARPQAATAIVAAWERDFAAQPVRKWLPYLYVANDVVQTTRQKLGPLFKNAFFGALCRTIAKSLASGDHTLVAKTERMINVWEERRIMTASEIDTLRAIHASRGRSVPPQYQTAGAEAAEPGPDGDAQPPPAKVDIEAEVARAAASVRDTFEDELASTDEEASGPDGRKEKDDDVDDPIVVAAEVSNVIDESEGAVSSAVLGGESLDLEDADLGEREADFITLTEAVEFETVGDTLAMEKVERLAEMLDKLQKGLAGEEVREDQDPAKADDATYETVRSEEKLSLEFRVARAVLEAGKKRSKAAKERNEKLSQACETILEDSANAMDAHRETLRTMESARKDLRTLARIVFLESNRRKRKRLSDARRAELEENAKSAAEAPSADSSALSSSTTTATKKESTASRVESFLSSMKPQTGAPPLAPPSFPGAGPPLSQVTPVPPSIPPPSANAYGGATGGSLPPIPPPGAPPVANRYSSYPAIPPPGPPPSSNAYGPGSSGSRLPIPPPGAPPPGSASYGASSSSSPPSSSASSFPNFSGLAKAMASARGSGGTGPGSYGGGAGVPIPPPSQPQQGLPPIPPPGAYPPPPLGPPPGMPPAQGGGYGPPDQDHDGYGSAQGQGSYGSRHGQGGYGSGGYYGR